MITGVSDQAAHDHLLEIRAGNTVFDLEGSFRSLLDAVGGFPEMDTNCIPRIIFDVCMDGRRYTVSISEAEIEAGVQRSLLSPRERQIVQLIIKGLRTKEVAPHLGLRQSTVNTYAKRIYLKLQVNSRTELVAKVLNEPSLFISVFQTSKLRSSTTN